MDMEIDQPTLSLASPASIDEPSNLLQTPPRSPSHSSNKLPLKLDLSNLSSINLPTPPTNTLIFTNLLSLDTFLPDNLHTIRDLVSQTAAVHSWAPLKSFRRIVVSFFDEDAAADVRRTWDNKEILGQRCRIYYGQPTPICPEEKHLALPDAGRLFFISPPPSPPHGWQMRLEDAPNKMMHAEDLAEALSKLRHQSGPIFCPSPVSSSPSMTAAASASTSISATTHTSRPSRSASVGTTASGYLSRQRSRSVTVVYQPQDHGSSPNLPSIAIEVEEEGDADLLDSPISLEPKPIMAHTQRPPVELMES